MGKKKKKTRRDTVEIARSVVEQATGEMLTGEPLNEIKPDDSDPTTVELQRRGGLKGGKARARKLTAEQRKEIARRAANARWQNKRQ